MDLRSFAGLVFNPIEWINRAWGGSGNQNKEEFVHNSVARLQLYMKQLNNSLDETSSQIASSTPHAAKNSEALKRECEFLQEKLLTLEMHVIGVEKETGTSIKSLQRIDKLKSQLEYAASALQETEKWGALATSLEEILDEGVPMQTEKLKEVAEQVRSMSDSLETMNDCPEYNRKKRQLENIYNRLEAAISGSFVDALTQMDRERTGTYVSLYSGMHRTLSASRCWRRAAAGKVCKRWARAPAHSVRVLTRVMSKDAVKHVDWLKNVLKSETPLAELVRLYTDLLLSLNPSPIKVVTAKFKLCQGPEQSITMLCDLRTEIDDFINTIDSIIDSTGLDREELTFTVMREFGCAAFAPLKELLPKYADAQAQVLLAHLEDPSLKQEDLLEGSRAILVVAEKCETWLETAYNQGTKIAGSAIYPYYATAVESFTTVLLNLITTHTRKIESSFLSSVKAGEVTGVLSETFPASLVLENATGVLLDTFAKRQMVEESDVEVSSGGPLEDLPSLLLDEDLRNVTRALPPSVSGLRRARDTLKGLARSILRSPIDVQLDKIPQLSVWHNNDALSTDLPDFALSPQEYITEIGQYLMTLPQHLEMHVSEKQSPWQFLTELCVHTCDMYAEKILNIRNMDALGTKRCLTDIVYLSSVVEDLGSKITPSLKTLEKSLRAATPASQSE
ncbi:unnamed protein product, partial [Brenthis ino]